MTIIQEDVTSHGTIKMSQGDRVNQKKSCHGSHLNVRVKLDNGMEFDNKINPVLLAVVRPDHPMKRLFHTGNARIPIRDPMPIVLPWAMAHLRLELDLSHIRRLEN